MATIMSSPWARLMIFITPMMMVMPMPSRAYRPPRSTPDISVCSRTSSWTEDMEPFRIRNAELTSRENYTDSAQQLMITVAECGFGLSFALRFSFRLPHSALDLLPLPPRRDGKDIGRAGVGLRPYGLELPLDDLDRKGLVEVLVLVAFLVLELDRSVSGFDVCRLERITDCGRRPFLGPGECVRGHVQSGIGRSAVVGRIIAVVCLVLFGELLRSVILELV